MGFGSSRKSGLENKPGVVVRNGGRSLGVYWSSFRCQRAIQPRGNPPEGPWLLHPDCLHAQARRAGIDENDPTLLRAMQALKQWRSGNKWRSGTTAPEEMNAAFQQLNAALDAFLEAHKNK